jgi:hypothetical protein
VVALFLLSVTSLLAMRNCAYFRDPVAICSLVKFLLLDLPYVPL